MNFWCKKYQGKRSSRAVILWSSMPFLIISILLVAGLWITFTLLILFDKFDRAASHLLDIKKEDLIRKSEMSSIFQQQFIQNPVHNNYIFSSFLKEALSGGIPISERTITDEFSLNFNDVASENRDLGHSQWFSDPSTFNFEDLSNSQQSELKKLLTLFPLFTGFLSESLAPENGTYKSIYYATEKDRLFFQFPAFSSDILK